MQQLYNQLEKIYETLEQINSITINQTTVLLQTSETKEEVDGSLEMLEDMVSYKEIVMTELEKEEQEFDTAYTKFKGTITDPHHVRAFKEWVDKIMAKKKEIMDAEKNNVTIMQNISKRRIGLITIQKDAKEVARTYKKQQTNILEKK